MAPVTDRGHNNQHVQKIKFPRRKYPSVYILHILHVKKIKVPKRKYPSVYYTRSYITFRLKQWPTACTVQYSPHSHS